MEIYMILARDPITGAIWLVDAMDDDSISGNDAGWREIKDAAYDDHGPENIRIIKAAVDFDAVDAAFATPSVSINIKES